jgi:hypothetical protein
METPMRRSAAALVPACLALLVACQRPEVEAYRQHPRPMVVACAVTPDGPGAKDFAATLEAALRVRLATRVEVVPEGITPPADAVRLEVQLERKGILKSGSGAAVGWGVGVSVGALSAAAGDRDWFFDGLFWGLFAGSNAEASQDRFGWLGYYPDRIEAQVRLMEAGDPEPLAVESLDTGDILPALEPLRGGDGSDETRVEEAEAQAFARVLVGRLTERFQWRRGPARYYGAPALAPEAEAPKPEPLNQPDPPPPAPQPEAQPAPEPGK